MAEPTCARNVALTVENDADALRVARHSDMENAGAAVEPTSTPERGVPGMGIPLVVGAAGVALRMRRRAE